MILLGLSHRDILNAVRMSLAYSRSLLVLSQLNSLIYSNRVRCKLISRNFALLRGVILPRCCSLQRQFRTFIISAIITIVNRTFIITFAAFKLVFAQLS